MAGSTRTTKTSSRVKPARNPKIESVPDDETAQPGHEAAVCTVGFCPICLAVTAMQPLRPDVVEHLLNAGKEFLLAARSVLDARADDATHDGRPTRLEKIDIG
jgi:hypothetical protein